MVFFLKKMSQNDWATIMPFGPVTNFLLAQKYSGTAKEVQLIQVCPKEVQLRQVCAKEV